MKCPLCHAKLPENFRKGCDSCGARCFISPPTIYNMKCPLDKQKDVSISGRYWHKPNEPNYTAKQYPTMCKQNGCPHLDCDYNPDDV